jgi:hypothetical protein
MAVSKRKGGRQCEAIKGDGDRCQARAINGSDYCFFHDPGNRDKFKAASVKGGRNRLKPRRMKTLGAESADVTISSADNILKLLSDTINQVRHGEIDVRIGNAIGYLSGIALRAIELGKLEDRLAALEQSVEQGERKWHPKEVV